MLLWLTENYYPRRGGMAQSCDRIVHHLRKAGVEIYLVHFINSGKVKTDFVQNGINMRFPLGDGEENSERSEADYAHALNCLWNLLQKQKFTHVVAFGGYVPMLSAPVFAAWLNVPLITLLRGNDFDVSIFSAKRREMLLFALQRSACVCSVSKDKIVRTKALLPEAVTEYIPNGIELENWQWLDSDLRLARQWRETHVRENRRVIGIFGHLKAKKGVLLFGEALRHSGVANRVHLLIAGELSAEMQNWLDQHHEEIHYSRLPFMDRFELLPYYAACDVVAISSFYDGLPNVLLEAGGLGVPFIASNVSGMADVLQDGVHGFMFEPGNMQECAMAIHRFVTAAGGVLQQMRDNCKKLISEYLNHQLEASRYVEVLKRTHTGAEPFLLCEAVN